MTEDDNGDLVRILQSKTHYPFFSYYIQDIKKEIKEEANSEEEICIQETFEYLSHLSLNSQAYHQKILDNFFFPMSIPFEIFCYFRSFS